MVRICPSNPKLVDQAQRGFWEDGFGSGQLPTKVPDRVVGTMVGEMMEPHSKGTRLSVREEIGVVSVQGADTDRKRTRFRGIADTVPEKGGQYSG